MTTKTTSFPTTQTPSPTLARASSKTHRLQRDKRTSNASNRPRLRKPPKPVPLTIKERAQAIREHKYFWPSVVLGAVLLGGLLWQAISIASNVNQQTPTFTSRSPKPNSPSTSPSPEPRNPSASPSSPSPVRPIDDRLAEAVQGALSDAWNLDHAQPSDASAGETSPGAGAAVPETAGDVQDNTPAAGERMRTLQELYADMEALGMNVDDMTQVLHRAQREADA